MSSGVVENVYDLAEVLSDRYHDDKSRSLMFPRSIATTRLEDIPLIAIVGQEVWMRGDTEGSWWEFLVHGQKKNWIGLTDRQRMAIRTAKAWDGCVGDYWDELKYEDERYYVLEGLERA